MRKLDIPLEELDDWDFLQAAFEGMLEETASLSKLEIEPILEEQFPQGQSKAKQVKRLKAMLKMHNEFEFARKPRPESTPPEVLEQAYKRVINAVPLDPSNTVRRLLIPFLTASKVVRQGIAKRQPWTKHFWLDFWEFLTHKKVNREQFLDPKVFVSQSELKGKLQPGQVRTLAALKNASPNGLEVKELAKLTKKDVLAEETPLGALYPWLSRLKAEGYVHSEGAKTKKWFFVKDYIPYKPL